MIRVSPEYDSEKIAALCKESGIVPEENALCYFVFSDEKICGICMFKLIKDGGRILVLRNAAGSEDRDALIIAGRTCLDFIERKSGFYAYFEEKDAKLAEQLGFKERDGRLYLDMHGYFGHCKSCLNTK